MSECPQLLACVEAAGGAIGKVVLKSEPGLGRGVYAKEDLKKGDVLFRLPDSLIVTTERALKSSLGQYLGGCCKIVKSGAGEQTVIEAAAGRDGGAAAQESSSSGSSGSGVDTLPELTERSVLYAYVLQARHCAAVTIDLADDEVDCNEYARSLPVSFSTPFAWRAELRLLPAPMDDLDHDGVDLVSELGNLGQHLQEQFAVLKAALASNNHALQQSGQLKVSNWLWAHQAYSSRCFPRSCLSSSAIAATVDETDSQAVESDGVMVPLLDMFNSVEDPSAANWTSNVSWEAERGEACVNCDVAAGSQIFSSFGPKGNRTLLACYGYCRWGNPFERVAIWVSSLRLLSRDEADGDENMRTLQVRCC